ncbi:2-amino-4-hydroxy-6-hydroxymethyldihydropteridine diphosphokinase [Cellulomonas soli]|uniref:Bifunctional folate synthesis protein n=1 Tax=Cellulomonas soli TaxID=931535 RepID=A0A512PF49_9CELL|nr:2-amino-4-hydroxy-6-hydroxymethyldihydropteridine diphosphokinase [Cellulomonas soli]NYI59436.1 dihydroneopterin aldolase/2-amino-4-hydroxy-6-hydroxymethyldihydropteridine diphosphokinase [Cellulomonas soli]GEP69772.1 hypothetical protein CSO01_24870 [Cellulomonas soli]
MSVHDGYAPDAGQPIGAPSGVGRPRPIPSTGAASAGAARVPVVPVVHDADGRRLDQILLSGISAVGYHGVFDAERREGQVFVADVVVHLDTRRAASRDDLALTVNYGVLAEQVAAVLSGEPADLIETVAERIAATVLVSPLVSAVDVQLHKPQAPITVPFGDVVVAVHRDRTKLPAAEPYRPPLAPSRASVREAGAGVPTSTAVMPVTPAFDPVEGAPSGPPLTPVPPVPAVPVPAVPGPTAAGPAPAGGVQVAPVSAEVLGADMLPWSSGSVVTPPSLPLDEAWDPNPTPNPASAPIPTPVPNPVPVFPAVFPTGPVSVAAPMAAAPVAGPVPGAELVELVDVVDGEIELDVLDVAPAAPVAVVLAIGANLGNAQETLRQAVSDLAAVPGLHVDDVSALARSAAVGGPEQPDYLNAVLLARTTLSARDLLRATQAVEQVHGRERLVHWGPRTLDVDIVTYGAVLATTDDLELPHPRAHERAFVLQPWAQVDPDAVLPGLGGGPVAALAATAPDRDGVRWLALDWLTSPVPAAQPDSAPEA